MIIEKQMTEKDALERLRDLRSCSIGDSGDDPDIMALDVAINVLAYREKQREHVAKVIDRMKEAKE